MSSLLLDAKTYKTDYVSPNMERLLGLTQESVRENVGTLAMLLPKDTVEPVKNYLAGLAGGEQREWDKKLFYNKYFIIYSCINALRYGKKY